MERIPCLSLKWLLTCWLALALWWWCFVFFFPLACSLPSHFMLRLLMPSTNCNVQGTTAYLPNVFHQTQWKKKKISEGSQDTFTCQATNGKALRGSRGCKLWGLIHNHSAAKTFSTDETCTDHRREICNDDAAGRGGNSISAERCHYQPIQLNITIYLYDSVFFYRKNWFLKLL